MRSTARPSARAEETRDTNMEFVILVHVLGVDRV